MKGGSEMFKKLMTCPETAITLLLLAFFAGMAVMYLWLKANGVF